MGYIVVEVDNRKLLNKLKAPQGWIIGTYNNLLALFRVADYQGQKVWEVYLVPDDAILGNGFIVPDKCIKYAVEKDHKVLWESGVQIATIPLTTVLQLKGIIPQPQQKTEPWLNIVHGGGKPVTTTAKKKDSNPLPKYGKTARIASKYLHKPTSTPQNTKQRPAGSIRPNTADNPHPKIVTLYGLIKLIEKAIEKLF
jgi:hypothetical protein